MKNTLLLLITISLFACKNEKQSTPVITLTKIAFGSCGHQDEPQPMLTVAANQNPDAFIFLGDNIYGDSRIMDTLKNKYDRLGAKPEFQNLRQKTKVYAVWDDHDYGENDAGRHYPFKAQSKAIFMDFWKIPRNSEQRRHEGIYGVEYIEKEGLKTQIILLDTRTFRDDLIRREKADSILHKNDYVPNQSPDSTFLGAKQWSWLETQLSASADIRIIASSNQFGHEYNGWESWTNVPHEQQRMVKLIKKTKAKGVFFISGDVHWGEISKMDAGNGLTIYDVTSSGITSTWYNTEPNNNRVGKVIPQNNIGLISITGQDKQIDVELALIDSSTNKVVKHNVALNR